MTAIAELEYYGLTVKTLNFLEEKCGVIYLEQLFKLNKKDILDKKQCGSFLMNNLVFALTNFANKTPVYTEEDLARTLYKEEYLNLRVA